MQNSKIEKKGLHIIYAAFKGFGDLLSAAPTIIWELNAGNRVTLFLFPLLADFVTHLDFGSNSANLDIEILPTPVSGKSLRVFFKSASRLSPDLVWLSPHAVQTEASWKIPLLFWFARLLYWPRAKIAGASSEPSSRLFDELVPVDRTLPLAAREWVGFSLAMHRSPGPHPPPVEFSSKILQQRSAGMCRYDVVIHPGASWQNKKWPIESCLGLVRRLAADYKVAVLGLESEVVTLRSQVTANSNIFFVVGSIEQALLTIAGARVAVTMDSGAMHFASSLKVPTISLFGPTDPAQFVDRTPGIETIYQRELSCQSCWTSRCRFGINYCMELISVEAVEARVRRHLADPI